LHHIPARPRYNGGMSALGMRSRVPGCRRPRISAAAVDGASA
jgi:hypothetical protein